ncbi:MAG TPA: hypothetical protein PKO06_06180, partial [Candidatus Ozemobacteraceae bacterium]|nr:hypothetical protein [Candidatus Ozemobacteraceae bacterium]
MVAFPQAGDYAGEDNQDLERRIPTMTAVGKLTYQDLWQQEVGPLVMMHAPLSGKGVAVLNRQGKISLFDERGQT